MIEILRNSVNVPFFKFVLGPVFYSILPRLGGGGGS